MSNDTRFRMLQDTVDLAERIHVEPCITNQEETHTYIRNVWNEI